RDQKLPFSTYVGRLFLAMLIGAPIAYVTADLLPGGDSFQQTAREVVVLAFSGLILLRHVVLWAIVNVALPQRILVLGTGPDARAVESALVEASPPGIQLVGFFPLVNGEENSVAPQRVIAGGRPL